MEEAKRQVIENWLRKALHDLKSAQKLADATDPYYDTAIYHCQQAAEKAIKGFLAYHDQEIAKTHDVEVLLSEAGKLNNSFAAYLNEATLLSPYATAYRYPEDQWNEPDLDEVTEAISAAQTLYNFVLSILPHEVHP